MTGWQIAALVGLGALHGLNPAMGWLFSVYAGLKDASRRALIATFGPIALGHAAAVGFVLVLLGAGRTAVASTTLRLVCGGLLVAFALLKLARRRAHPAWVGLRLRPHELAGWSFLMSTAHGAGLMLLPIVATDDPGALTLAAAVHTVAMLAVLATISLVVYETIGVAFLRRAWVNVDRLWATTLLVAGAITIAFA